MVPQTGPLPLIKGSEVWGPWVVEGIQVVFRVWVQGLGFRV